MNQKTNVYFVYKNENLNEVDPLSGNIAIAVKGNDNYYSIYTRGSPTASNVYRTLSDPRDLGRGIFACSHSLAYRRRGELGWTRSSLHVNFLVKVGLEMF
jgi:hypothetical protein